VIRMGKAASKPARLSVTAWVIRAVVVVALLAFVGVGLTQTRARQSAVASHAAVAARLASADDGSPLRKSEIQPLLQGAPKMESVDGKSLNSEAVVTAERYTWPGVIRHYTMTVGYGLGSDPEVEVVEGPK
jgi:hypothetical protein